ncbi:MAG: hypothetical protein ACRD2Z_17215 [Thermoanaerobaculia bacterium]
MHRARDHVDLERLAELTARRPCREVVAVAGGRACHVVGGAVRDCLIGRSHRDLDLLVDGDGARIARQLAERLSGRLVDLGGEAFASWRIALAGEEVDLWDRAGATLEQELARRDLTVNALAVELPGGRLCDPLGGLDDLGAGKLRTPKLENMRADPLRALRLVRLAAELPGFTPTADTVTAAREAGTELERVAGERIREEWSRLLRAADPVRAFRLLRDVELYPRLWAETSERDPARTAASAVARLHEAAEALEGALPASLPAAEPGIAFDALLLAALSDPLAATTYLARRRYRSGSEATRLRRLLSWPILPGCEAACRRFLHRLANDAPTGLLWLGARALAEDRGSRWREAVRRVAALETACGSEIRNPAPLLTGDFLAAATGLSGRALGRALDSALAAQVLGTVRTRDEALALVRRLDRLGVWDRAKGR